MRQYSICWYVIALLTLGVSLAACQVQTNRSSEIANASSPLLEALIQESDLSGEWHWESVTTKQQIETPEPKNQRLIESATRLLRGSLAHNNLSYIIGHELKRYEQNPLPPQVDGFRNDMGFTPTQAVLLNFAFPEQSTAAGCWRTSKASDTVCTVVVSYLHFDSSVTIYAPPTIDDETLTGILNQVLSRIDNRVKVIDK